MKKIMILPLFVGFICMFLAMAMATQPGSYNINDRGDVVNTVNGNDMSNVLIIESNGLVGSGYFGAIEAVNNQTGQSVYHMYNIVTTKQQLVVYDLPETVKQAFIKADYGDPNNRKLIVECNNADIVTLQELKDNIYNGKSIVQVNIGNPYAVGSAYHDWSFYLIVQPMFGTNLSTALDIGYGFDIYLTGHDFSSDNGVTGGNIFGNDGMLIIFITAAIIGGIAAITIFGSQIDAFGQRLIFISATYILVWAMLSVTMYPTVMQVPVIGIYIWLVITAMYMFGVISELMEGGQ